MRCNTALSSLVYWLLLITLTSCGDISSKILTSGSSGLGFISYFIQPEFGVVIAVKDPQTIELLNSGVVTATVLSDSDVMTAIEALDTTGSIFSIDYCDIFAESLDYKLPARHLQVTNAPFIAEKNYLELMTNYCYTYQTFFLENTRINDETDPTYGAIRWFRNQPVRFGSNDATFDYLISQATNDRQTRILSVFKQIEVVSGERLYGTLQLTHNQYDNTTDFRLVRYFVDDATRNNATPNTFRMEGYAMSTDQSNDFKVHYTATYYLDYQKTDSVHRLIVHHNTMVVYENWGSKLIEAEYCEYKEPTTVYYDCEAAKTLDSDKATRVTMSPTYYADSGNELDPDQRRDRPTIARIETVSNLERINRTKSILAISDSIPAPIDLASPDLEGTFDTSKYLNFDRP